MRVNFINGCTPKGVRELSPGWSEAEPWVFELIFTPLSQGAEETNPESQTIAAAMEIPSESLWSQRPDSSAPSAVPSHFFHYPGFRYAPPWAKLPRAFGA